MYLNYNTYTQKYIRDALLSQRKKKVVALVVVCSRFHQVCCIKILCFGLKVFRKVREIKLNEAFQLIIGGSSASVADFS